MKDLLKYFVKAIPLSLGLILSLTALSFLVAFTDGAELSELGESNFLSFLVLALLGIPTLLFGIERLSRNGAL
jgi:hypothetical protein